MMNENKVRFTSSQQENFKWNMGCCSSVPRENKSLKTTESTSNKYSQIPNELRNKRPRRENIP